MLRRPNDLNPAIEAPRFGLAAPSALIALSLSNHLARGWFGLRHTCRKVALFIERFTSAGRGILRRCVPLEPP